jgi:hypothetical protein
MGATKVRVISREIETRSTTQKWVSAFVSRLLGIVILCGVLLSLSASAQTAHDRAWSLSQEWNTYWMSTGLFHPWGPGQEKEVNDYVTWAENKYYNQLGYSTVGQLYENGSMLTDVIPPYPSTSTVPITFGWADPNTGELVAGGPAISSVDYYAYVGTESTPFSTDLNDLANWSLVGQSTDSSGNFLFDYTFPTSEQIIVSVPLDSSGDAISLGGPDGYNAALDDELIVVNTPEPTSLTLFGIGALSLLASRWRRKAKNGYSLA